MIWTVWSIIADAIGWICMIAGGFFCLVGAIGLNRMPDLFTRMHSVSVAETLGVGLLIIGMLVQSPDWMVAVRLVIIGAILFVTSPVSSHALARAALVNGAKPQLADADGVIAETDCAEAFPDMIERLETRPTDDLWSGGPPEEQEDAPSKP